jgi:uncharacterized membrane protein
MPGGGIPGGGTVVRHASRSTVSEREQHLMLLAFADTQAHVWHVSSPSSSTYFLGAALHQACQGVACLQGLEAASVAELATAQYITCAQSTHQP